MKGGALVKILGIDMGSREVKIVQLENGIIKNKIKMSTMKFYKEYCEYKEKLTFKKEKLDNIDADYYISTGYGRNNIDLKDFTPINEIKAHAYGAMFQTGNSNFTLLDVGGQDVKAIKIENSIITDLDLNDKCASSCGRYLENMANVLEVSIEELSSYKENPVILNSTCAVFSESELIGKIAEGISIERLCAGVNYSMYKRLEPIVNKFPSRNLIISGGVAYNESIVSYLKKDFENVKVLSDPQYNGAIGCCYFGYKKFSDNIIKTFIS